MSDHRPVMHSSMPLIEALLDGTISDADFARLDKVLREDREARALYRSMVNLHAALPGVVAQSPKLSIQVTDGTAGDSLVQPHEMSHLQLMDLLMQVEEKGQAVDPMALASSRFPAPSADVPTGKDWYQASRYLLGQSFGRRAVAAGLAVAAAVALLVTVLVLLPAPPESDPLASGSGVVEQPAAPIVATLTGERRAMWRAESGTLLPAVGDGLAQGRRLTLVDGFAEITTLRGAVVLLEGPASIELIEDDNTVYLYEGRLVGRCETASSKGFVVRTDRAVVTDLGTEFGVAVAPDGSTQAAVFTGEIELGEVDRPGVAPQSGRSVRLAEGWASSVAAGGRLAEDIVPVSEGDRARFAKSLEEVDEPGFAYRRAVLALEPTLYWPFESLPSGGVVDIAGRVTSVGQVQGGQPAAAPGVLGRGVLLGQSVDQVTSLTSVGGVLRADAQAYTINLWVKPERVHHGRIAALVGIEGEQDTSKSHLCAVEVLGDQQWLDQAGQWYESATPASLRFLHRDPLGTPPVQGQNLYSGRAYEPGQWMLVTVVKSPTAMVVYHNGVLAGQVADGQAVSGPVGLAIGSLPPGHGEGQDARAFVGVMDEVSVFDRALDAEQIKALYELGAAELAAGL